MEYIKKLASAWRLNIDPDFRDLFPRSEETKRKLKAKILAEGCRDPLVVWRENNTLIDGHTRLEICEENTISFAVEYMDFASKGDAMKWELGNQEGRRNMTTGQRIEAAMKVESVLKEEARERRFKGDNQYTARVGENFPEAKRGRAAEKLGAIAGVSGKTYEKGATVLREAPEEVKDMYKAGKITTEAAYKVTKMDDEGQKSVMDAVKQGKAPKEAIHDVIERTKSKSNNPAGYPREVRERHQEIRSIVRGMTDVSVIPEYTIGDLIDDIRVNADVYIDLLRGTINERMGVITEQTKGSVLQAIDTYIVNRINEIKEKIA